MFSGQKQQDNYTLSIFLLDFFPTKDSWKSKPSSDGIFLNLKVFEKAHRFSGTFGLTTNVPMNKEVGETKQYVKTMAQMKLACAGVIFFCVEGRHSSAEEQQR